MDIQSFESTINNLESTVNSLEASIKDHDATLTLNNYPTDLSLVFTIEYDRYKRPNIPT